MAKRLTAHEKQEVCDLYVRGENTVTLGKRYGVSHKAICGILDRRGIQRRGRNEAAQKRDINATAFDVLTEEACYWIGFSFADGTLAIRGERSIEYSVVASIQDEGHIEKLKAFLNSNHQLIKIRKHGYVGSKPVTRFSVKSYHLGKRLAELGMGLKSLDRIAPRYLAQSRDFWRGVVDGDGYFNISNGIVRFGLVGGKPLLEQFLGFLKQEDIETKACVNHHKSIYVVNLAAKKAVQLLAILYKDCSVALERKQIKAIKITSSSAQTCCE